MSRWYFKRVFAAVASALMLAAGATVVTAGPAVAAGGGCIPWDRSGWSIQVCGSNQGRDAYLDFYVNGVNCSLCGLTIYKQIEGNYRTRIDNEPATYGHHGPWEHYLSGSQRVRLIVEPNDSGLSFAGPWVWY